MISLKSLWEWFSWGKELQQPSEQLKDSQPNPQPALSDNQRNATLKSQVLNLVAQGYTLKLEQEFVAILELPRKRGYFLYFLIYFIVNVPLIIFLGIFWLPILTLWTIGLIKRVSSPKIELYRLEVLPSGIVQFGKSN